MVANAQVKVYEAFMVTFMHGKKGNNECSCGGCLLLFTSKQTTI